MKPNKALLPALVLFVAVAACDRTSSPEGRTSIKLEQLQKEMRDSLKKQHTVILDSLSKLREAIQRLEQQK
jgi:hypothetical protein